MSTTRTVLICEYKAALRCFKFVSLLSLASRLSVDTHNSSFDEGGGIDSRRSSEEFYLLPGSAIGVGAGSSLKEVMSPISEITTMTGTTANGQPGSTATMTTTTTSTTLTAEEEDMQTRRASLTLQVAGAMPSPSSSTSSYSAAPISQQQHHHPHPHPLNRAASVKSSLASSPRFGGGSGGSRGRSALQRKTSAPTGVVMRPTAAAYLTRSTDGGTQG